MRRADLQPPSRLTSASPAAASVARFIRTAALVCVAVAGVACGEGAAAPAPPPRTTVRIVSPDRRPDVVLTLPGGVAMPFVRIPAQGADADGAAPTRSDDVVAGRSFLMAQTEVTRAQWAAVMGSRADGGPACDETTAQTCVSWDDVTAFVDRLSRIAPDHDASLPTPAQWEFACRAGSRGAWCFGDAEESLAAYARYSDNSPRGYDGGDADPVRTRLPNAWGLYDMHGGVAEWCTERRTVFASRSGGPRHVLMGGSRDSTASEVRCDSRRAEDNPGGYAGVGIRPILLPR